MTGVAGFDFQWLNRRYIERPANDASEYGVSILAAPPGPAWRCIGIYHLRPEENNRRHNVFVDVLDETGKRTRAPWINWAYWINAPTQVRNLDKPGNEPACDIPINMGDMIRLWVNGGGLPSDMAAGLHARHNNEGDQNTRGHHSFYVVFQRREGIAKPPDPPPALDLTQRVTWLETQIARHEELLAELKKRLDDTEGGK